MITFKTNAPRELLNRIKQLIDQKHITTWTYDSDNDFTHCVPQWNRKAWLRPRITWEGLIMNIVPPIKGVITWELYGIFQGRFIESVTIHAHDLFTDAVSTALPQSTDITQDSHAS